MPSEEIEKNEDGTLTTEQADALAERAVSIVSKAFSVIGSMTPSELLEAHREGGGGLTEKVNEVYAHMLEVDVPKIFNDYTMQIATGVMQRVFTELSKKNEANTEHLIAKVIGKNYDDITPQDIVKVLVGDN